MAIPEAGRYIRRFVISFPIHAPDYSGPDYDSVVEAWFDSVADMNALYFSENFLKDVALTGFRGGGVGTVARG